MTVANNLDVTSAGRERSSSHDEGVLGVGDLTTLGPNEVVRVAALGSKARVMHKEMTVVCWGFLGDRNLRQCRSGVVH